MKLAGWTWTALVLSLVPSPSIAAPSKDRVVADFNSGTKPNNLGGDFGCWISDPKDEQQGCLEAFDGGALRMVYSVESTKPAFGGLWFQLQGLDVTPYDRFAFRVRGDPGMGFTTTFKVELKDLSGNTRHAYVRSVGADWSDQSIPLAQFEGTADLRKLKELVVVVEDRTATSRRGLLYFDDLRFAR